MGIKSILFIVALFLLSSCSYEKPVSNPGKALIFIVDGNAVDEPKFEIFVITEDNPLGWYEETREKRYRQSMRRSMDEYEDNLEESELRNRFANVRRIIVNEFGQSEFVIGYDKELDNPDFKKVESDKMGRMYSKHYTFKIE